MRKRGKMADKGNELPAGKVIIPRLSECRHPAQTDAILDRVVKLAVGRLLSALSAHIRWARIQSRSKHGVAPAVIGVADGAVICPMRSLLREGLRVSRQPGSS